MLRKLIVVTALAAGMSVAAAFSLTGPALAKGPSQASITGPGLVHAIVLSGNGEPGLPGPLATLAGQTGLFNALFGAEISIPDQLPTPLRTPPPRASLGPRYTVIYTVPGLPPQPGEQFGQLRQDVYPDAVGGPVVYTPPGQDGFGQLQVTGWLRASPQLTRTLIGLGVPRLSTQAAPPARSHAAHLVAAHRSGSRTLAWLTAAAVAVAVAAVAATALLRYHRRPATVPGSEPRPSGPAPGSA